VLGFWNCWVDSSSYSTTTDGKNNPFEDVSIPYKNYDFPAIVMLVLWMEPAIHLLSTKSIQ